MSRLPTRRTVLERAVAGAAVLAIPRFLAGCAHPDAVTAAIGGAPAPDPFGWFGLDRAIVGRVLSTLSARGADFGEIYLQHSRSTNVALEDGIVSRAATAIDQGAGLRVVVGDQVGYAFTEDLSEEALLGAAQTASAIAAGGGGVPPAEFVLDPAKHGMYTLEVPWSQVGIDQKLPILTALEAKTKAKDPSIVKVSVTWSDGDERILIADTLGRITRDDRPSMRAWVTVTAKRGEQTVSNSGNLAGRHGPGWMTDERMNQLAEMAVSRTLILFDAARPPAGEMPVVLAAGASGILLHEAIGHGMEADFNRKGTSIYSTMIGKQIAPDFVTIVDSGLEPGERGALNVDDEGSEAQRTVLVEKGILKTFLHDRISAKHYGVASTGSGRRESFRHVILPRMRCTFMEDGPHTREEIIASVPSGIIAETFTNGQVQIGAGDFTFYIKNGWLIENGKVTRPIKDVNIIGNGPEALKRVSMAANDAMLDMGGWTCGKDGQSVPVSQGLPTVKVDALTVEVCVDDNLLERGADLTARAKAAGASDAVAKVSLDRTVAYTWRAGKLETATESTSRGASLSLYVDGRWSVHETTDLRPASLDTFVRDAVALTRALAPDPDRVLPDPARYPNATAAAGLDLSDPAVSSITREKRLEWLAALEAGALGDDRILSVSTDVSDSTTRHAMVTTNGFAGEWAETGAYSSASVTVRDADDRRPEDSWGAGGHFVADLVDPMTVGKRATERALARLGSRKGPSGAQTMVVDPRAGGNLVSRLLGPASARSVQQQQSFWAGKLGKKLLSPKLTLADDPLVPRGLASRPWDGEGMASKRLVLIDKGVPSAIYVDTYYGRKAGMAPTTGSASNRQFALGDRDLAAWIKDVKTGIYVTSWLGGNSDGTSGDYSLGLRGFEIVNGAVGRPVGEMNATGNLVSLFAGLVGVGNDPWPYSASYTPTLVFENVSFSGV